MFKINWCKIFGHKTYTTERLKKRHNGTRKRQVIIICTTRCMRCGKVISKERVWIWNKLYLKIILTILLLYELKRYNYVKPYNA